MAIELPQHIKDKLNSNDLNAIDSLVEEAEYEAYDSGYYSGLDDGKDDYYESGYADGFAMGQAGFSK